MLFFAILADDGCFLKLIKKKQVATVTPVSFMLMFVLLRKM